MKFTKRLQIAAVSAATLLGTLAMAAPASAATGYYYKPCPWASSGAMRSYYHFMTGRTTPTQPTPAPQQPAPQQPAPAPQQPDQTSGLTAAEQQMLNLVNQERAKAGLAPLKADLQLTKLARMKSQDMIAKNYFSHQSPTYGSPFDMMRKYGVTYRTAGENIAGNGSVPGAHTALMNSSGHRANILGSQFTHVGIGIVPGGRYGMMFTQMFVGR